MTEEDFKTAVYLVEATGNELQHLWADYSIEGYNMGCRQSDHDERSRRVTWRQDNMGFMHMIGEPGALIGIGFFRNYILGYPVVFYDPYSGCHWDSKKVDEYIKECFPHLFTGSRHRHINATNFHICIQYIRDIVEERMKPKNAIR